MEDQLLTGFPLFPLGLVALPGEGVPLHIFEKRYRRMIDRCMAGEPGTIERAFGIVWMSDQELKPIGCACELESVLERMEDGRLNILARGTMPFRLLERQDGLPYPAGVVGFLIDDEEKADEDAAGAARELYRELVHEATDREIEQPELEAMDSYAIAATIEFPLDEKQELLELRSENVRMRTLGKMLQSALERLALVERAQERARSNGKVRFG